MIGSPFPSAKWIGNGERSSAHPTWVTPAATGRAARSRNDHGPAGGRFSGAAGGSKSKGMGRRALLLLACTFGLAAAAPRADAGEILRYRRADGSVGLVDDPAKLPPDAVVERRVETVPPPAKPAPSTGESVAGSDEDDAAARATRDEAARDRAKRCERYSLPPACSDADLSRAGGWVERGARLREAVEQAEQNVAWWEARLDECEGRNAQVGCPRGELDRAQTELAARERALDDLEDDCRRDGCLPGWLRQVAEPEPE
jgi:hypothetical protein